MVPANTFDNVRGPFPISFQIWNGAKEEFFIEKEGICYDKKGSIYKKKNIASLDNIERLNKWINLFEEKHTNEILAYIVGCPPDFQHNNQLAILSKPQKRYCLNITNNNLIHFAIYYSVRHCIFTDWLNDRDQFLYPKDGWQTDTDFQTNCLAYTLFHGQNRISSAEGTNHWIPFKEQEVNAPACFSSHFMTDFISGKLEKKASEEDNLFTLAGEENPKQIHSFVPTEPLHFTPEAEAVFTAGKALWQYYFTKPDVNINASLYDIREYFQGRNDKGKMNNKSEDENYNILKEKLNKALKNLALQIIPKVYEYRFLIA